MNFQGLNKVHVGISASWYIYMGFFFLAFMVLVSHPVPSQSLADPQLGIREVASKEEPKLNS